ncbi:hypothetical protein AVEN_92583-1 [Araneus ventricosus]|uniref:Uncharacterized protein n=1 Tax=Araneus ventricosus TaxID=182803 RepID=A0A4Y2AJI5_ARAVE|nr:hypothetical protein AVEN_92583-1 [Araneus ventricosus]
MTGGSVMAWRPFTYDGLYDLQRISGRMGSVQYQAMLYDHLIPFRPLLGGAHLIFQQDNAFSIHLNPPMNGFKKKKLIFCHGQVETQT